MIAFQNPEGKYQSKFMVPIAKKYLAFADASAIFPKIGVGSPPLGLYTLILTAVSTNLTPLGARKLNTYL